MNDLFYNNTISAYILFINPILNPDHKDYLIKSFNEKYSYNLNPDYKQKVIFPMSDYNILTDESLMPWSDNKI